MSGYEEDDAEIDEMMKPAEEGSHEQTSLAVSSDDRSGQTPRNMEDAEVGARNMEDAMESALTKLNENYKNQDAMDLYNKIKKDVLGEAVPRSSLNLTRWIRTTRTCCSPTKYVVQQSSSVHHPINLGSHARNWCLTPYNVALEFWLLIMLHWSLTPYNVALEF
jgi:hypothetical protein